MIIGDKVTAYNNEPLPDNDVAPDLELQKEYDVVNIHTCKCGQDHIDVGLVSHQNYIRCHKCEEHLPNGTKVHWCHPSRFVAPAL